jgi:hypothetical protein
MKKVLLLSMVIAGLFISTGIFAQNTSFGVKGGFDLFNATLKYSDGTKENTKMIPAFNFGAYAYVSIAEEFFIRPELAFAEKGTKITDGNTKLHVSYLELPVSFLYKGAVSDGKVLVGIGPYIALGIGGKVKYNDGTTNTVKFKNKITENELMSETTYMRPIDFGGKVYAGYELKNGLFFTLETSLGLTNAIPKVTDGTNDSSAKHVGFGLNVGYKIK